MTSTVPREGICCGPPLDLGGRTVRVGYLTKAHIYAAHVVFCLLPWFSTPAYHRSINNTACVSYSSGYCAGGESVPSPMQTFAFACSVGAFSPKSKRPVHFDVAPLPKSTFHVRAPRPQQPLISPRPLIATQRNLRQNMRYRRAGGSQCPGNFGDFCAASWRELHPHPSMTR